MNASSVLLVIVAIWHQCIGKPQDCSRAMSNNQEPIDEEHSSLLNAIETIIQADHVPQPVTDGQDQPDSAATSADEMPPEGVEKPASEKVDRIVGGQETTIEEHPYQVSFTVDNKYFCGGFIISEDYIVTAAHCAQNVDPKTVLLRAGSSYRNNGTIIPIAEVTPHPLYNQPQFDKDVAVMKTAEKINFTDAIQPIPLADKGRAMRGGTKIVVSGWGRTRYGASTIPQRLMDVEIPVVNHMQCYLVYSSILTNNEFCAGNFFLGGQGTCQGDSGGGAVQDGLAVGIVSYGRGCGQPLSPSVFADIASEPIRTFIKEKTGL